MADKMTILFNHGVTYIKVQRIQRCDVYRGAAYTEVRRTQRCDVYRGAAYVRRTQRCDLQHY